MRYSKQYFAVIFFITLFNYTSFGQTKISAIQAKLFYNEKKSNTESKDVSGTFSENIIDNSEVALWNTVIGEGSAEGYSNQTIVIVEITTTDRQIKIKF